MSKALIDHKISHDEYAAVLRQAHQYRQQKLKHRATLKYNDIDKVKNVSKKTMKSLPKFAQKSRSWLEDHDKIYTHSKGER